MSLRKFVIAGSLAVASTLAQSTVVILNFTGTYDTLRGLQLLEHL